MTGAEQDYVESLEFKVSRLEDENAALRGGVTDAIGLILEGIEKLKEVE